MNVGEVHITAREVSLARVMLILRYVKDMVVFGKWSNLAGY